MAHQTDALFFDVARDNTTAIAFSLRGTLIGAGGPFGVDIGSPIFYETTGGAIAPWATVSQVDQHGVTNLDALEIWGRDGPLSFLDADVDHYSEERDPLSTLPAPVRTSIFNSLGSTYLSVVELAAAVFPFLGISNSGAPGILHRSLLDLDALMMFDAEGSKETFDIGDWIMFSLAPLPIAGPLNPSILGDEVFVWQKGGSFGFLSHGGHLWDSGWHGGDNVDALEVLGGAPVVVPEPSILSLALLGFAGIAVRRRRRRTAAPVA